MAMNGKASGKAHRKGMSLKEFLQLFSDDATAERWFIQDGRPSGVCCPECRAVNVQTGSKHESMPYHCREIVCGEKISVKAGSIMEGSKLGYQDWITTMFPVSTSLRGASSMKLHRDLGVSQKTAWFLSMRIRKALSRDGNVGTFNGPVEVGETYFGGKRRNMSNSQRKELTGRGPVGKTAVVGAKDRATNQVVAKVVTSTGKETLQGFVKDHTSEGATVYDSLPFDHASVKHSHFDYVKDDVHASGIEAPWSLLKRAHEEAFYKLSPKYLDRYVQEFAGRHNVRELDTMEQMRSMRSGMDRKRLIYEALIADNELVQGARV